MIIIPYGKMIKWGSDLPIFRRLSATDKGCCITTINLRWFPFCEKGGLKSVVHFLYLHIRGYTHLRERCSWAFQSSQLRRSSTTKRCKCEG